MYVVHLADAGRAVSSIRVHLAAIKTAHLLAGLSLDLRHPRLAMVIEGVTRSTGVRPRRKAAPAVPELLRRMLDARPRKKNRSARATGRCCCSASAPRCAAPSWSLSPWATSRPCPAAACCSPSAARRPTRWAPASASRCMPTRPSRAAAPPPHWKPGCVIGGEAPDLDWTATATIRAARPLFCAVTKAGKVTGQGLSDKAVVRLMKQAAADAGLDAEKFSGHSLRRGLLTAGADNRAQLAELMRQSRHRSAQSVLGYLEPVDLWRNNVTDGVFGRAAADDRERDPDPA